jgi:hypothetical protein
VAVTLGPDAPGRTAGVRKLSRGYDENVAVDVVAVLVLVLMAADVFRMLFVDTEPQRGPVRREDS